MKILFHLAHPAQFHMFKHVIRNLSVRGHEIKITINTKDILEQLLKEEGMAYENILLKRRVRNTKSAAFGTLIRKDVRILWV